MGRRKAGDENPYPEDQPAYLYGSSTRAWLNQNVTPALLEGVRHIALTKPDKPLEALGQFLINYDSQQQHQGN